MDVMKAWTWQSEKEIIGPQGDRGHRFTVMRARSASLERHCAYFVCLSTINYIVRAKWRLYKTTDSNPNRSDSFLTRLPEGRLLAPSFASLCKPWRPAHEPKLPAYSAFFPPVASHSATTAYPCLTSSQTFPAFPFPPPTSESPGNRGRPFTISAKMHPIDHTSTGVE